MRTFGHNYIPTHSIVTFVLMLILVSGSLFFFTDTTVAAPNYQMNYQGKLTDASNVAVPDGTYNMRFWILTSNSIATTSAEWTESLTGTNRVQVTNGLFSVMLGSTSPLTGVDFNQMLYLGVEIGSTTTTPVWDGEMSPRKILGTVPAAFEARQLDGLATTSFLRADQDDTATGLLTFLGTTTHATSTFALASTTNLRINGETFSGLTGTGLTNTNGFLTVATNTLGLGDGSLSGLTDTDLTGVATGSLLVYDGGSSTWVKRATSSLGIKNTTGPTLIVAASDSLDTTRADYVADGTNDEEQIQAAIDALPAGGGTVQLLEGTFNVGTTTITGISIRLATGTQLIGSGPGTVIRLEDSHGADNRIIQALNVDSVTIANLVVDGNLANQGSGSFYNIEFQNTGSSTIKAVTVKNAQDLGLHFLNADGNVVANSIFINNAQSSGSQVSLLSGSDRNKFLENTFRGGGGKGINLSSSNYNVLENNRIINAGSDAIAMNQSSYNRIVGNLSSTTASILQDFGISSSNYNVFSNNTLKSGLLYNIDMITSSNNIISNNVFDSSVLSTAIRFSSSANDNLVSGNAFTGTAPVFVTVSSGARNTIATNSYHKTNGNTTYISDSGTDTRYTDQSRITLSTATERAYSIFTINASSSSSTAEIRQLGSGDILDLYNPSGRVLTVTNAGYLGIGTTTPNQLLSVAGSMHLSGAFFDSTYASGTNGMVLLSTGAGTTWVATNTLGISGGAATLDGLTDTDLTGVATGSVLVYDGGSATWVSRATSTLGIAGGSDTNTSGPTLIVAASDSLDTTRADYVADGTNDQDTIEQALAALPAGGGTVQLLEGTFNINNAIDITQASTSLIGSGPATLLKITATSTSWDVIDVASAAATHHVYIGNLAIDGSAALAGSQSGIIFNAATSTIEGVAISNMRGPGVQIYEVSVKFVNNVVRGSTLSGVNANAHNSVYAGNILENNGQYGLTYQGNYSVIANNISSENTDSGIYAQYSNDNVFVGNTTKDNGQAGFEITLSDNNTVMGNTASGNTTYGIVLDNSAEYNTVSGNTFDSNSSVGVYITYSALNTITGNTVRGNLYGIVAEESNNNTISSNLLSGNGGGTNASIWMYSNSTDNIITGNNIVSTGSGALIQIDSGSNRNYVANNFYENPDSTTYITDNGTDTRYTDQSRITLSTATERAYSIFTINASSSSSTAEIQQLGSGDILNLYNSSSQVFTVDNNGYVGIGTTTPTAKFALTGTAGQTSPLLRISSSTEAVLFEIMSDGSFDVGSGALYYDVATNETSIERLNLGAIKFEDSAGWVSWIDVAASTSASAGDILAYTAQIDSQDILTLYSEQDGSGGIGKVRVVVGTSSAALYNSTNIPGGSFIVSDGIICVDDGGDNCDDAPRARGGLFATTTTVTAIDLAENYPTKDAALSAGELAMLDPENPVFVTTYDRNASTTREDSFIGVVSTAPGVLLGGWGSNAYDGELQVPITLSGRVPVKVNFEGGDILPGDRIAFSSVAGVGMRATTSGITAGIALEPYIATSTSASTTEGTIVVFVNNAYHTPKSQFVIDGNGNVAFGTSTDPNFKVKVGGDIAATGFINISASSTKRDIAHLDDGEKASLLEAIRDVDVATYNYKSEASSSPKRLGLIAEEAPSAVLSVDGKGVDLYKLATLAILGVQQNDDRLTKLEASLGELLATSTEASGVSLLSRLTELARNFVNGVLTLAGLHTQELCVGDTCVDEATFLKMVQDSGGVATTPTLDETDGSDEIGTTTDTGTEDVGTSTPGVVTDETTDSATTTPSGEGGDNVTETSEDSNPQPEEQVDSPVPQVPNNNSGVQSDTGTTTTE